MTALVPINNFKENFTSESAKLKALARVDVISALENLRKKYSTKKEADAVFLDLYNSGLLLPLIFKFIGTISIGTLHRWVKAYEDFGTNALIPNYKYSKFNEYDDRKYSMHSFSTEKCYSESRCNSKSSISR